MAVAHPNTTSDLDRLLESLGALPSPQQHASLLVVSGLPGSGKSHLCRQLTEVLPIIVLETDALRRTLFAAPTHQAAENARLFRAVHELLEVLLRLNHCVALDATNLIRKNRKRLYRIAENQGASLVVVRMDAPESVIRGRLRQRSVDLLARRDTEDKSDAGTDVYVRMKATEQAITREHIVVDSSIDISPAVAEIVRRLGQ